MKTTIILLFIAFVQSSTFSQNYLYETGTSGFHISGQIGTSKSSTLLGISPGYTMNGKLTFGLTIGAENFSELDLNSTAIRPYLDLIPLKQGENNSPISLNLGVHYQYNSFPKISGLSVSTFGFSANLLHTIESGNSTLIVPSIGVGWDRSTLNLLGITSSENTIGVGLSTAAKINNFYVEPMVSFRKGGTQFGVSIGVVLGK